ncbi:carbonic anhydrase family protein [Uruburuella testudinis]|uniref:carbonic anhydrase n=1 Tax=Uruburuella testudinis TaxID=1282863 RepID=A0ABY4DNW0_9NEIS|nr:carbonic anhydrase family protein [Uruburuella testudinis]UOO80746.1 carbonic anhydrase family protein [Uruburuella testudinis]
MQNRILLGMLAAAWCAAAAAAPHAAQHWSYQGNESPAHWGGLSEAYALCRSGKNQSPVDLAKALHSSVDTVAFGYLPQRYEVENNGHTVEAKPQGREQTLAIGGKQFVLKQFHFHTPSEHTFKGRHFPMEAHFVHQTADGELAVVAVMFEEGRANPALAPLLADKLKPGQSADLAQALDIMPLFPANRAHFRLNGSLTTPPCSEGVYWVVMETPVSAAKAQIAAMHDIIGYANNRPLQPLNARVVVEEAE